MLILARTRSRRPGGGYARSFVKQMEQVIGACLDAGIKVVSNAGGLDPRGCAEAVAEVAERMGLSPRIACVDGDDLMARLDPSSADAVTLRSFATGEPMTDTTKLITANAYLGGWGIAEALRRGADIVVTGRVTDAAVACGPAAWHHGWAVNDWDALAGAVAAGHVIECGTQATGGNYSFFTEVDGMARTGFPWAEIAADGSCVIGKHEGTRRGGHGGHRHRSAALRDRRPRVSRARRHDPLRTPSGSPRPAPTGCASIRFGASRPRPPSRWPPTSWAATAARSPSRSPGSTSRPRPRWCTTLSGGPAPTTGATTPRSPSGWCAPTRPTRPPTRRPPRCGGSRSSTTMRTGSGAPCRTP